VTDTRLSWTLVAYFGICVLAGGASNGGFLANAFLQIIGLALLALVLMTSPSHSKSNRWLNRIGILAVAIGAFQFLPLPIEVWEKLPGRAELAEELALLEIGPGPVLLTLSYHESLASLTWWLPVVCLFVCLDRIGADWERSFSLVVVSACLTSLLLGFIQILAGKNSPAYIYEITNPGFLVGTFANANHMATLLLVSMPFLAASFRRQIISKRATSIELGLLAGLCAILFAIGIALVGSLTGYALAAPVIIASCAILFPEAKRAFLLLFVSGIGAGVGIFLLAEKLDNFFGGSLAASTTGREVLVKNTWQAIIDFFPAGTGLGTFQEVYTRYESLEEIDRTFANHAHNDYLEILLEFGLPGALVIALFFVWWLARARIIWTASTASPFAKAAVIASSVLLVHSGWDYPLRTVALGSIFAVCCLIMSRVTQSAPHFEYKNPNEGNKQTLRRGNSLFRL